MIELPDFVNGRAVEHAYRRMIEMQNDWRKWRDPRAHSLRVRGMNMARARHPKLLLFLEKGAEYLRARNDEQLSRVPQEGYARVSEFNEFAQWRTAYQKACEPNQDERLMYGVFGWVYAAAAEAVG